LQKEKFTSSTFLSVTLGPTLANVWQDQKTGGLYVALVRGSFFFFIRGARSIDYSTLTQNITAQKKIDTNARIMREEKKNHKKSRKKKMMEENK